MPYVSCRQTPLWHGTSSESSDGGSVFVGRDRRRQRRVNAVAGAHPTARSEGKQLASGSCSVLSQLAGRDILHELHQESQTSKAAQHAATHAGYVTCVPLGHDTTVASKLGTSCHHVVLQAVFALSSSHAREASASRANVEDGATWKWDDWEAGRIGQEHRMHLYRSCQGSALRASHHRL